VGKAIANGIVKNDWRFTPFSGHSGSLAFIWDLFIPFPIQWYLYSPRDYNQKLYNKFEIGSVVLLGATFIYMTYCFISTEVYFFDYKLSLIGLNLLFSASLLGMLHAIAEIILLKQNDKPSHTLIHISAILSWIGWGLVYSAFVFELAKT
jgi:hypothetical protein